MYQFIQHLDFYRSPHDREGAHHRTANRFLVVARGSMLRLRPESSDCLDLPIRSKREHIRAAAALLIVGRERHPFGQHQSLTLTNVAPSFQPEPGHDALRGASL